ncbi:MAG: hypothetical protein WC976_07160 [Caldisericia bacterium]
MLIKFYITSPDINIERRCYETFVSVDKSTNVILEMYCRINSIANRSQDFCEGIFPGGEKIVFRTIRHLFCRAKESHTRIGTILTTDTDGLIIDILKLSNDEVASIFQQIVFHESTSSINCVSVVFQEEGKINIERQRIFVVGYLLMNEIANPARVVEIANECEGLRYGYNTARA